MPVTTKICRVCGKEYEACKTMRKNSAFHYQEVACSPECGSKYLAKIAESRGNSTPIKKTKKKKSSI